MLTRLISGNRQRPSRLHDAKGNFVGWIAAAMHGPPAVTSGLLRLAFGYRPAKPWIPYSAIRRLRTFLGHRGSRVLEFGSGMSTLWYSVHAGEVFSVENYRPWYNKITRVLQREGRRNVSYKFVETEDDYVTFMGNDGKGFDLIMVDGSYRSRCIEEATQLLRPGGILYLDDSDQDSGPDGGDMRRAEGLARQFAGQRNAKVEYFTDFSPTQLFVKEGMLVQLPRRSSPSGHERPPDRD